MEASKLHIPLHTPILTEQHRCERLKQDGSLTYKWKEMPQENDWAFGLVYE